MLDFAEVHLMTGGLLANLLEAMENVIRDLEHDLETTHTNYRKRTGEHN